MSSSSKSVLNSRPSNGNGNASDYPQQLLVTIQVKMISHNLIQNVLEIYYFNKLVYTIVPYSQKEDTNSTNNKDTKNIIAKPIEENLTPDFKKKLQEWRIKVTADLAFCYFFKT